MSPLPTDRTYPLTRIVAGLIVPFLLAAFIILYLTPDQSAQRFAWAIRPNMTALYIGAGYLGGAVLLFQAARGARWHTVGIGFPIISVFTAAMLLATLLHLDRFDPGHLPFQIWLVLYIAAPLLVPAIWLWNRREDPRVLENGDPEVPLLARLSLRTVGLVFALFAVGGFAAPDWLVRIWVWPLTALTARVLAGWFALLAAGGLLIGGDRRWSSWRVGLGSIFLWHLLVGLGAFWYREEFSAGLLNWYTVLLWLGLLAMGWLFLAMERRRLAHPGR